MSLSITRLNRLITAETKRQRDTLMMIPSENYASPVVLAALGSPLTNKYAEGYPGRRYYAGNTVVDEIESAAQVLALDMFGLSPAKWHANVQPHSGSGANLAAYWAVLKPGDTILAMDLAAGGHLTHGSPVSITGRLYTTVHYNVDPVTQRLDYAAIAALATKHRPKLIVCGATAYPRLIDFAKFKRIARSVGALVLADIAHIAGLVAAGVHPSPFPHADIVTMTTHKTLGGPRGAIIICKNDYAATIDKAVFPGLQGGPMEHAIAAKAICFAEQLRPAAKRLARQTIANTQALAATLLEHGLTLITDGSDNHLLVIDCRPLPVRGSAGALLLESVGIIANSNMIPYDPSSPRDPSGIRLGTPALTRRGLREREMRLIGTWIATLLQHPDDHQLVTMIKREVLVLTKKFPLPY